MANEMKFKRYEVKFKISRARYMRIQSELAERMIPDSHGRSTIFSLYYDTPDYRLVRRSMEHPEYKEKLRLRSYGAVGPADPVFLELKKKYQSVVYKRRIEMTEAEAFSFCAAPHAEQGQYGTDAAFHGRRGTTPDSASGEEQELSRSDAQIRKEIRYALAFYQDLKPRMLLSYEREAWYAKEDHGFRITFDQNILWRETEVNLHTGAYGMPVIPEDMLIMEVKTGAAIPLWLTGLLTEERIYKTSFSKYATAYCQKVMQARQERMLEHEIEDILAAPDIRSSRGSYQIGGIKYA